MPFIARVRGWFGFNAGALNEQTGEQYAAPSAQIASNLPQPQSDTALQLSVVWSCIERRANVVASLPLFVYQQSVDGHKELARNTILYQLLHDSPNSRMTPFEFWRAMMINYDLRGNAYARIERNGKGYAIALWPMPADQVRHVILPNGDGVYYYRVGESEAVLSEKSVLHLKNLGNGTTGLSKLEYMSASIYEASSAQAQATDVFKNGGKPTGLLMVDKLLTKQQRDQLRVNFHEIATGPTNRLQVLEAGMKYQPLNFTPEQIQLLDSRKFSIEELCRWYDVPPVLAYHSNVTTWGSGIEQIIDGWHKLAVRPLLVCIEQAVKKSILTPDERVKLSVEFSHDALLRGSAKDRYELYSKGVTAGVIKPNEARQLENLPPVPGGDVLLVQRALVPIQMAGESEGNANATA